MTVAQRLRRLLTPGHAAGFAVVVVALYFVWGRIFEEGGTGSNVVLGLLLAAAGLWVGTQQLGPVFDEALASEEARERMRKQRAAFEGAMHLQKATKSERKNKKTSLTSADFDELNAAVAALFQSSLDGHDIVAVGERATAITNKAFPPVKVSVFVQVRSLSAAFAVAIALRTFAVAPFQIPSGSMIPTLLIGDHLFVWRATYGLQIPSKNGLGLFAFLGAILPETPFYFLRWTIPQPGDVVVFEAPPWVPANAGEDWIKRVVAGPGQQVRFENAALTVDGRLYQQSAPDGSKGVDDEGNPKGEMTTYDDFRGDRGPWVKSLGALKTETLLRRDGSPYDHSIFNDMPPRTTQWPIKGAPPQLPGLRCTDEACTVEDGYVFVMGDNRDNSSDGRIWGAVPIDNIKGKAVFIWVSVDGSENSLKLGRFSLPRFRTDRLGDIIH